MEFIKKLSSFWLLLLLVGAASYFSAHNLERIYVNIPHFGEFKMRAAVAFMFCFLTGATVTVVYFGWDSVKKSVQVRRMQKRINKLEQEASMRDHPEVLNEKLHAKEESSIQTVENPT